MVEGEGGPGIAEVRAQGVELQGPAHRELTLVPNTPQRIEVPVTVKTPPRNDEGALAWTEVLFRMAVERTADAASDAFEADELRRLQDIVDDLLRQLEQARLDYFTE